MNVVSGSIIVVLCVIFFTCIPPTNASKSNVVVVNDEDYNVNINNAWNGLIGTMIKNVLVPIINSDNDDASSSFSALFPNSGDDDNDDDDDDVTSVALESKLLDIATQTMKLGDQEPCNNCQLLMFSFELVAGNNATVEKLIQFVDTECTSRAVPSSLHAICEKIGNALVHLLPTLIKRINSDPYSPFAICSMINFCTINCCETTSSPEQIHLALGPDESTMTAVWNTLAPTQTTTILYGLASSSSLNMNVTGNYHTYTNGSWNGTIHVAVMTGLQVDTQYNYQVGDPQGGWSEVYSFHTIRVVASSSQDLDVLNSNQDIIFDDDDDSIAATTATSTPNLNLPDSQPYTFAVIGDMGVKGSDATVSNLLSLSQNASFDLLLHVGDISYADGFQEQWDIFMRKIQPIVATVPYMVVPGNHEIAFDFASYKNRFAMPGNTAVEDALRRMGLPADQLKKNVQVDSDGNMYYSFNYGPIHFLGISTESPIDLPQVTKEGLDFIKQDLSAYDTPSSRAKYPWIVVLQHRPLYCTCARTDCSAFADYLRLLLEDLFIDYHVDLVVAGHIHEYERTLPVKKGVTIQKNYNQPSAPTYVISGAAGSREGLENRRVSPMPEWSAYYDAEYGYSMMYVTPLSATNQTSLRFQFISDVNNVIKDDFTITKTI